MIAVSEALKNKLEAKALKGNRWLKFDDMSLGNLMLNTFQISKDAKLSVGTGNIKLSNILGTWNLFLIDKTYMGRVVELGISIDVALCWDGIDKTWNEIDETWENIEDKWTGIDKNWLQINKSWNELNDCWAGEEKSWNEIVETWNDLNAWSMTWGVPDDVWGKSLKYFTGTVEDVAYNDASISLKIRDKMTEVLNRKIGDGQSAVKYSASYNPADLVWDILVNYGYLDDTASTANVDIDYTSWSDWKTNCTTLSFELGARFTGQNIRTALERIAYFTNSYIWISGDGKFSFNRPIPPFASADTKEYNKSNSKKIDVSISNENLVNKLTTYYNFSIDSDSWEDSYTVESGASQNVFGIYETVDEDKNVWHQTLGSAKSYADRIIDINKNPQEMLKIESTIYAYLQELSDIILVTEALKGYDESPARITKITYNYENGSVNLEAEDISDEQLAAFYLDDEYWGQLDATYNPLY